MAYANGRIPASALAPIPGGRLRKDAALRWNAMNAFLRSRGLPIVMPNGPRSSYRILADQQYFWRTMPRGMAAYPGTSNHGWGLAVDVNNAPLVNRYGAPFGWQKKWSDAQHEAWHMKWAGFGKTAGGSSSGDPTIRKGTKNPAAVVRLQKLLRGLNLTGIVNGHYGIWTRRAVRRFQKKHGMKVDGVVGPATWKALRQASR